MTATERGLDAGSDGKLEKETVSPSDPLVSQAVEDVRAKIAGTSVEIDGKRYNVEFIEGSDPNVDAKIQEFYDFMAKPGHIHAAELADVETFKHVLRQGEIAMNYIQNRQFDRLRPKTQPYFFINIRDPETGDIVSAMSGAMILAAHEDGSENIPATFMLSYIATAQSMRGKGLPQIIATKASEYFDAKHVRVTSMLTEGVDTFEKGANKINRCSRLYVRREDAKGQPVMQQIEYLMPSQEYSLDGEPLQGTTDTSNLMMSFVGKDPTEGILGKEVKANLRAMWEWIYFSDFASYEERYAAAGEPADAARINSAVARNNAYVESLLQKIYSQFGDEERIFPVTAKEREASVCTFTKVPLAQVESVKEFHLEELSPGDLENAVKLATTVFPDEGEHPKRCFEASLNPNDERNQEYLREINVDSLKYWVAKGMDGTILGITGFYTTPADKADVGWVGWYCVDPKARGLGVGTQLLNQVEAEALSQQKKALRLYTSDRDTMETANLQYEKRGYKEIYREPSKATTGITTIIRQKDLATASTGLSEQSVPPLNPENVVVL